MKRCLLLCILFFLVGCVSQTKTRTSYPRLPKTYEERFGKTADQAIGEAGFETPRDWRWYPEGVWVEIRRPTPLLPIIDTALVYHWHDIGTDRVYVRFADGHDEKVERVITMNTPNE